MHPTKTLRVFAGTPLIAGIAAHLHPTKSLRDFAGTPLLAR